jgi:hypothetical protein
MRIVFMSWRDLASPVAGGSEILVDRLARGMVDAGHEVTLVAGGPNAPRPYRVVANGSHHTQYLRAPFTFHRHVREADLVVDVSNGMTFFASLWQGAPTICLVHHVHVDQWGQW